jgi:hypothetical protein
VEAVTKLAGEKMSSKSPRILLYDIETSLQLVSVFQLKYNDYIDPDSIVQERHVISVCYKWLGENKVHAISLLDDPKRFAKDPHDDTYVVKTFYDVMASADCIVAHNGDQFDSKYLKTRMLVHGLPPLPPITSIDTYKVAKQHLLFNSNRLDYLGKLLGFGGKKSTPKGLWLKVLNGDKKAIQVMVDYNRRDVTLLEQVFLKLRPFVQNHINRGLFGKEGCPRCGSKHVQHRGLHKAISRTYQRMQCQSCGGWFRLTKPANATLQTRIL